LLLFVVAENSPITLRAEVTQYVQVSLFVSPFSLPLSLFFYFFSCVETSPLGNVATVWPIVPAPDDDNDDDDDCGAIGGMRTGSET
jgi:hypothetical protein